MITLSEYATIAVAKEIVRINYFKDAETMGVAEAKNIINKFEDNFSSIILNLPEYEVSKFLYTEDKANITRIMCYINGIPVRFFSEPEEATDIMLTLTKIAKGRQYPTINKLGIISELKELSTTLAIKIHKMKFIEGINLSKLKEAEKLIDSFIAIEQNIKEGE